MIGPRKNIVLFFLFGGAGGAERMTLTYAKMLPKDRFRVCFVICGKERGIVQFIPDGYEVEYISWRNIHCFPRTRLFLKLLRHKPDFVFSSTTQLNILLLQVAHLLRVKCVVRSDNMVSYFSRITKRRIAWFYNYAYKIVAQTEEMQNDLQELSDVEPGRLLCLHNPVDTQTIDSLLANTDSPYPSDDSINYVCIANFMPTKGHDTLIKAFELVYQHNPKAELYLIGNTSVPNFANIHQLSQRSIACANIHFPGFQKNPYKWMKFASCFVLPSRIEGLPNVLIEAMYVGTPVVATKCVPIISRLINDGNNGYIVDVDDYVSMANAMERYDSLKGGIGGYNMANCRNIVELFI